MGWMQSQVVDVTYQLILILIVINWQKKWTPLNRIVRSRQLALKVIIIVSINPYYETLTKRRVK